MKKLMLIVAVVVLVTLTFLSFPAQMKSPTGMAPARIKLTTSANTPIAVNLEDYFSNSIAYSAANTDRISAEVQGNTLVLIPEQGFTGQRTITIFASDGKTLQKKRIRVQVLDSEAGAEAEKSETGIAEFEQQAQQEPSEAKVEAELEDRIAREGKVNAIILFKEAEPPGFAAKSEKYSKLQELNRKKQRVKQIRKKALANLRKKTNQITGAAVSDSDVEIIREYETVNSVAVELTGAGLEILRQNPDVAEIVLDRQFTTSLADSIPLIDADDAHGLGITGRGETICIIDTGLDLSHPAFTGRIIGGYDFVNNDGSPQDDASNSHGTHAAGIAAGSSTITGAAPDALIVPVKVCNSNGGCTGSNILAGIDYCNDHAVEFNITAISGSLGDNAEHTSASCPTIFDNALNTSISLGIIPVFASGNNHFTNGINYPACSPYAVSVGSVNDNDAHSSFSNKGGDRLDVLAPGEEIVSSVIGGGTGTLSGTSMSTPHIAGAVALIQQNQKQQDKEPLTVPELRELFIQTGKQVETWHRADIYNAIVKLNQNYTINITDNSITNATPPKAKIKFKDNTDFAEITNCSKLKHNFVEVDSVSCPQFNKSAHIILEGLSGNTARPLRNGQECPPDICQNITFNEGVLEFDVTEFTNYSGQSNFTTQTNCDSCGSCTSCASTPGNTCILTQDIASIGTCINVSAENVVIDCNGSHNITVGNETSLAPAHGINITRTRNATIQNCEIYEKGAHDFTGEAIYLWYAHDSTVKNTYINTSNSTNKAVYIQAENITLQNVTGSATGSFIYSLNTAKNISVYNCSGYGNIGLYLNGAQNSRIINNTFEGAGGTALRTSTVHNSTFKDNILIGGVLLSSASENNLTNTSVSVDTERVLRVSYGSSNNFRNSTFTGNRTWITTDNTVQNNFTNTLFENHNGSIRFTGTLNLSDNITLDHFNLKISENNAFLNTSNTSAIQLNSTAEITLKSITFADPEPYVDYEDDGTFTACTHCTELSYSGSEYKFNTTHFTAYKAQETISCPVTINASTTLSGNLYTNLSCITIGADDVELNCSNYRIVGNGTTSPIGINSTGRTNVTISNCVIKNFQKSILFERTNKSLVVNSTAENASSISVHLLRSNGSELIQNFVTSSGDHTLYLQTGSDNNVLVGNYVNYTGGSTKMGLTITGTNNTLRNNTGANSATGVGIYVAGNNHQILENNGTSANGDGIKLTGTSTYNCTVNKNRGISSASGKGIHIAESANNHTVFNNYAEGLTGGGLYVESGSTVINNTALGGTQIGIYAEHYNVIENNIAKSERAALWVQNSRNNITNNTLVTNTGVGIRFAAAYSENNTFYNNTVLSNATWIWTVSAGTNYNNFTNITFQGLNGSIRILDEFEMPDGFNISVFNLNITHNKAFLNSTNLSVLNITGEIILTGITSSNPRPTVDYDDDGSYAVCSGCTELGFTGNVFTYNTSHFTGYSSEETPVEVGCPVTFNTSTTLTQNYQTNLSCITIGADDTVLDCGGYSIGGNGSTSYFGINATLRDNITIKNCHVQNFSNNIWIGWTNNSFLLNNTALNATSDFSIYLLRSNNNLLGNNTGHANLYRGIKLAHSDNNTLLGNNGSTGGSNTANSFGIDLEYSSDNYLENNTAETKHGTTTAVNLENVAENNTLYNNTLMAVDGFGIYVWKESDYNTLVDNNATATGSGAGIYLQYITNATLTSNYAETKGVGTPITLSAANYSSFENNTGISDSGWGFSLNFNNNCTFKNNLMRSTASLALTLYDASEHTFTDNEIISGSDISIILELLSKNNSFYNNTVWSNHTWLFINSTSTGNKFKNTTFKSENGSITIIPEVTGTTDKNITLARMNISQNSAFLNSSYAPFLNKSAEIRLYNIGFNNPETTVDFEDDGTFTDCPSSICTELSFSGSTYRFNVTHFTAYAAKEGAYSVSSCPITINQTRNLSQNIASNTSCITFGTGNVTLDCLGYTIRGNNTKIGINATGVSNITIKNCVIINFSNNVLFRHAADSYLLNSTASNSSSDSIFLDKTNNTLIANSSAVANNLKALSADAGNNNTITNFEAESNLAEAMDLQSAPLNYTILNTTLTSPSNIGLKATNAKDSYFANISALGGATGIYITGTNITILDSVGNGSTGNKGIDLNINSGVANNLTGYSSASTVSGLSFDSSGTALIENSTGTGFSDAIGLGFHGGQITNCRGTSEAFYGVYVGSNYLEMINVTGESTSSCGICFEGTGYGNLTNCTGISSSGQGLWFVQGADEEKVFGGTFASNTGIAVSLVNDGSGVPGSYNQFFNITLYSNKTWIEITDGNWNNFTNTTFAADKGSIAVTGLANLSNRTNATLDKLNVTSNNAFLNSTNLTALNTTGQVTLNSITTTNPGPTADFEDDGTFTTCPGTICTEISFNNNVFVYNITHFTSYSSEETYSAPSGNTGGLGGRGGGGGGGIERNTEEQPPTVPTAFFSSLTGEAKKVEPKEPQKEKQEVLPEAENPQEQAEKADSSAEEKQSTDRKKVKHASAYIFYGLAFTALLALCTYWYILHKKHKK